MFPCDLHTHTIASGHATTDTITALAKEAYNRQLKLLGITEHGPATSNSCKSSYFRGLSFAQRKRFGIDLLYGVELNILDTQGTVDLEDEILEGLDYAIISLHPQNFKPQTPTKHLQAYENAMKHPKVRIIGHCDDVKYPIDYHALFRAAMSHKVVLELNNASLAPNGYRGDTRENQLQILKFSKQYLYPVILSSDSHGKDSIGDFTYILPLLQELQFPHKLLLNQDSNLIKEFLAY